jgi:hypothetical protein
MPDPSKVASPDHSAVVPFEAELRHRLRLLDLAEADIDAVLGSLAHTGCSRFRFLAHGC